MRLSNALLFSVSSVKLPVVLQNGFLTHCFFNSDKPLPIPDPFQEAIVYQ